VDSSITYRRSIFLACASALLVTSPLVSAPALAEQVIEEMVVTARKRSENLQDVPAAVAAFNSQELEERGVNNIVEIAGLTPNITVNETSGIAAGALQVFIRGIGNDPSFDQGVGIYVDDIYLNNAGSALLDVYDVERIEVLKGPQGHLYGRNTIGGAIKYVSAEPSDELRAHASAKIGTDDRRNFKAGLSGPLAEGILWGSVAVSQVGRDGYQTNRYDGGEYASQDVLSARGTLVAQFSESLRVKLVADMMRDRSAPIVPNRVAVNLVGPTGLTSFQGLLSGANRISQGLIRQGLLPPSFPGAALIPPGDRAAALQPIRNPTGLRPSQFLLDRTLPADIDEINTAHIEDGFDEHYIDSNGLALTATWDFAEAWVLKSITGVREVDRTNIGDYDGSDQRFINTSEVWKTDDFSQEFQLSYSGERINALLGYYFLDGEFEIDAFTEQRAILRLLTDYDKTIYENEEPIESTSFYANVDWDITEKMQLSLGGRLTTDKKRIHQLGTVELITYPAVCFINPDAGVDCNPLGGVFAPLVLSPAGWQALRPIAPNLPGFGGFLRDAQGKVVEYGEGISFPENKTGEEEWDEFTPSLRLSYRLTNDTLIYGGWSTGFKSGGFDSRGPEPIAVTYEPEFVTTWSIGAKSTLLDGTLRLNFEAFLNQYEDKQFTFVELQQGGDLLQQNDNVADAESSGAELEILWLPPVDGLAINVNIGFLDIEIDEFIAEVSPETMPGVLGDIADHSAFGYSPELNAQARIQYTMPVGRFGALTFGVDADYRDDMYTTSAVNLASTFRSQSRSEARTLTNAFVSFNTLGDRWRVRLEGKNLSDRRRLENTFIISNFMLGGYQRGRTWGLSVTYQMQ